MMNIDYGNAYKEVLVIINNLIQEDYEKIPRKYIEFLEANCNEEYEFEYDKSKKIEEQNLLDDTKYILFELFAKFGATDKQKAKINSFKNRYNNIKESQKREKYNVDVFSANRKNNNENNIQNGSEKKLEMVEYKNQKWYQKLISKLYKKLLKK